MSEQREGGGQHELIVQEALRRGLQTRELSGETWPRRTEIFDQQRSITMRQGIPDVWVNERAVWVCKHKQATKELFQQLGIRCPMSVRFNRAEELPTELFEKGRIYVCKPEAGTNGKGVSFDIRTFADVQHYFTEYPNTDQALLLEEFIEGDDLRIQVIGGQIQAACIRHPAYILGDGVHTLQELLEERRATMKRQNPSNELILDAQSLSFMKLAGCTLETILADQQKLTLKRVSNMGQGGIAEDCTERIDPRVDDWIQRIAKELKSDYFALDILATDIKDVNTYCALEINLQAEWLHHTFSEGRQHDLAKVVIDQLFADSSPP